MYMCQLTPLNSQSDTGPTNDHTKPRARVAASATANTMDAVRGATLRGQRKERATFTTFHARTTTIPQPAILCVSMKTASSGEFDTSPKKPLTSSTAMSASRSVFAHGNLTCYHPYPELAEGLSIGIACTC